jgi:flavodoxin
MKITIISYSLTGNNEDLAINLANKLAAEHIRITELKPRTMDTITADIVFNRTPKIQMPAMKSEKYDLIIFVGPVWMGHVATPFRACFKQLSPKVDKYVFISVSGGADGPNPRLADELKKRLGKEPVVLIDLHIADLLPPEPKPTRKDTMVYRINEKDIKDLTDTIDAALNKTFTNRLNN